MILTLGALGMAACVWLLATDQIGRTPYAIFRILFGALAVITVLSLIESLAQMLIRAWRRQ